MQNYIKKKDIRAAAAAAAAGAFKTWRRFFAFAQPFLVQIWSEHAVPHSRSCYSVRVQNVAKCH